MSARRHLSLFGLVAGLFFAGLAIWGCIHHGLQMFREPRNIAALLAGIGGLAHAMPWLLKFMKLLAGTLHQRAARLAAGTEQWLDSKPLRTRKLLSFVPAIFVSLGELAALTQDWAKNAAHDIEEWEIRTVAEIPV